MGPTLETLWQQGSRDARSFLQGTIPGLVLIILIGAAGVAAGLAFGGAVVTVIAPVVAELGLIGLVILWSWLAAPRQLLTESPASTTEIPVAASTRVAMEGFIEPRMRLR